MKSFSNFLGQGFQHFITMIGATVLAPLLMGFDPNVAIFCSGLSTIIFYFMLERKVPSYLGSSFAFIGPVISLTGFKYGTDISNPNLGIALGGILAVGFLYFLVGLMVQFSKTFSQKLIEFMPPLITGGVVMIVGINLASVAVQQMQGSTQNGLVGIITILLLVLASTKGGLGQNWWQIFSVLITLAVTYILYLYFGTQGILENPISFEKVANAKLIASPNFNVGNIIAPDLNTIFVMVIPVLLVLLAENLGHLKAIQSLNPKGNEFKLDNTYINSHIGRAFMADGIATMVSPMFGGTGVTTYAENIGVMQITRRFDPKIFLFAGAVAIIVSFSPKVGAFIATIPNAILAGLSTVIFGSIAIAGVKIWLDANKVNPDAVDFGDKSNLLIVGTAIIMAAGDFNLQLGSIRLGGIATATFTLLFLHLLLIRKKV